MTGKRLLASVTLATLLAAPGCLTCGHDICRPGLEAGPEAAVPLAVRQKVYLVLVNGLAVNGPIGVAGLRDGLAAEGFTKVYIGEVYHGPLFYQEVKRVHWDDPAARFVVVGYSFGGPVAAKLADDLMAAGVPVDSLVLLDSVGLRSTDVPGLRTVLVRSGGPAEPIRHGEVVYVPSAGHYTLPAHPRTVQAVVRAATASAARVELPAELYFPAADLDDAPPARPAAANDGDPEWQFLDDLPGPHNIPLAPSGVPAARRTVYGLPLPPPRPLPAGN